MVELAEGIVVASVAATFFSDIMSRTMHMIRGSLRSHGDDGRPS
jgi:hypothetical protein